MANTYPIPRHSSGSPAAPAAANSNYRILPGRYIPPPTPANDNFGRVAASIATGALRRARLPDWRAELAKQIAATAIEWGANQMFGPVKTPAQPAQPARIDPGAGWSRQAYYGSVAEFNKPGADRYGYAWPNVTFRTNYDYNFALAGWGGMGYVSEFFTAPGPDEFSTWAGNLERASGNDYWRVYASEKWIRTTAAPGVYPPILPATPAKPGAIGKPHNYTRLQPGWYRRIADQPHLDPHGDPVRGPVPGVTLQPGVLPGPAPYPSPGNNPRPYPNPQPFPNPLPRPPGKGVKETKTSATGWAQMARWGFKVIEEASEAKDFINSIWEGMPDWVKDKAVEGDGYKGLPEKIGLIYRHWPDIDAGKALAALAYNHVEDKVVGKFHGAVAKSTKQLGITRGPAMAGFLY